MIGRQYDREIVVGCQMGGCQGKCRKPFPPCRPIWDAEAFCRFHLQRAFEHFPAGVMYLRHDEFEESVLDLMFHLARMEKTFDPKLNDSFEGFVKTYLPRRAVDVGPRRVLGRNGTKIHNYIFAELDEGHAGPGFDDSLTDGSRDPDHFGEGYEQGSGRERPREEVQALVLLGLGAIGEVA